MATSSIELRWNAGRLEALMYGASGEVARDLIRRGNRVRTRAMQNAPVDRGTLRASVTMQPPVREGSTLVVKVGTNLFYAVYVHEGTGVYGRGTPIRPVRAKVLRWPARGGAAGGGGPYVFAREVRGVRGRPFLRDALEAAR